MFVAMVTMPDIDKFNELKSENPTIGRIAVVNSKLPRNRYIETRLALLGELVGTLPPYYQEDPGTKQIGNVCLRVHWLHEHDGQTFKTPSLFYDADILTTGEVNLSRIGLDICEFCDTNDISDHIKVMEKLGVAALYNTSDGFADLRNHRAEYGTCHDYMLDDNQIAKLQLHLLDIMPLNRE